MAKTILSKLTLIIPTYNRQRFVLRNMRYLDQKGPRVYVLDGSPAPIPKHYLAGISSKVKYCHWPAPFVERLRAVLPMLDSDYVALHGDDEFYLLNGLIKCIEYLEQNADYVACSGRALGFRPVENSIIAFDQYPRLNGYKIGQDDGVSRVVYHMSNYVPSLVYAVTRKSVWMEAMSSYVSREFPVFAIGELQMELSLSFAGKSIVLPLLTWLRSHGETAPVRGTDPSLDESRRFDLWWRDSSYIDQKEEFLEIMSNTLRNLKPAEGMDYRSIVYLGCEAYMGCVAARSKTLRARVGKLLPPIARWALRQSFLSITPRSAHKSTLVQAGLALKKTGVGVDIDALCDIENILVDFHSQNAVDLVK